MLFQLLDADYMPNGKPIIRLFGRDSEGKSVCCFVEGFEPYFYARAGEERIKNAIGDKPEVAGIEKVKKFPAIGYRKEPADFIKITVRKPEDVPKLREALLASGISEIYEADILFKYRYLIDKGIFGMDWIEADAKRIMTHTVKVNSYQISGIKKVSREDLSDIRYMAFDIECLPKDFTKPIDSKNDPIIMISLAFDREYKGKKTMVLVAKNVKTERKNILCFATEEEMLRRFIEIMDDYDPDIITGYNAQNFDLPYILERMRQNKMPATFGRCTSKQAFSRKVGQTEQCTVPGRVVFDPYVVLKSDPGIKFRQYDLNTVAGEMLGEKKLDIKYRDMGKYWNGTPEMVNKFILYAEKDSELALRLVTEKKLIDKFFALSRISGLLLQDTFGGQSIRVETKMMHEFRKRGMLMPAKPTKDELNRRITERDSLGLKGATVLEPKKGLHTNGCTLVLDFKSLYPSIIRTYNISPDTIILDKEFHEGNFFTSPVNARFVDPSIRQGTLPAVLKDLLDLRAKVKKEMKAASGDKRRILDNTQLAIKIMANSVSKDTDIVVKDESGMLRVVEIGQLFSELEKENAVSVVGDSEIIELDGWEALSIDGDRSCFMPMYAITRHKNKSGKLVKIRTKMGEVKVTCDHSIISMKGTASERERTSVFDGLSEIRGNKVDKETVIAQVNSVEINTRPGKYLNLIDVLNSFPEDETDDVYVYIPKSLNLDKNNWYENRANIFSLLKERNAVAGKCIAEEIGIDSRMLLREEGHGIERAGTAKIGNCSIAPVYSLTEEGYDYLSFFEAFRKAYKSPSWYCLPLKTLKSARFPETIIGKSFISLGRKAGLGRAKIPARIEITEELAELFGWYVSEGSCSSHRGDRGRSYATSIVNTDNKNQQDIIRLFEKVFGYRIMTISNKKQISACTKSIYLLFKNLAGKRYSCKRVPDFVMNGSRKIRDAFLRSYTKGDGDADGKRLSTNSKHLAAQLSFLLKEKKGILHSGKDSGMFRVSLRKNTKGKKISSGDLFGQVPSEIEEIEDDGYVYDLSVRGTEKFVTAQGIVLHNSFYGYTGFAMARLYVLEIASSITGYGRENLEITRKMIEEKFPYSVIYADTDSVFLETQITDLDNAKKVGEEVSKYVSDNLPGYLELDFEKILRTFLILTKKRYAGWSFEKAGDVWKDKLVMKGIETVRRDWCPLVSETMNEILVMILKQGDVKGATEHVKGIIQKLKRNEISLDKLTMIKGITKNPRDYKGMLPHIELAKKMTARSPENPPQIGDRLGFVIIAGNAMLSKRAEDPEYVKENKIPIDSEYYINCQLLPAIERILRAVDVTSTELLGGGRQVNICDIMNNTKRPEKTEILIQYEKPKEKVVLGGWEDFVCEKCRKTHKRMTLNGLCPCGGRILIAYRGSVADRCRQ